MVWSRFGDMDPTVIRDKRCVVFRYKRSKFCVCVLKLHERDDYEKKNGWADPWDWVTDYGLCHEVNVDDFVYVLPTLEITKHERY